MLVNSNYRYGGGSAGSSSIIEGYYNDSKFYQDDSFSTEITGESGKIYVDLSTDKTYRWNGSVFTAFNSGNADTVDGIHGDGFVNYKGRNFGQVNDPSYPVPYECVINTSDVQGTGLPDNKYWHIKYFRHSDNNGYGCQLAFPLNGSSLHPRYRTSSEMTWDAWKEITTLSDIPTTLPANGGRSDDIKVLSNVVRTSTSGLTCYHYETSDTSTYELPYGYVDLYRMMYASGRGVELAINWNNNGRSIWIRGNHGGWSDWKKLIINGEMYVNANTLSQLNVDTIYDVGTYSTNGGSNQPNGYKYGSLLVLPYRKPYGNTKVDYGAQIWIPNGDDNNTRKMYYRTGLADSYNAWQEVLSTLGGTMIGALVAQANSNYTTPQVRNITMSTSDPSGGSNGQVHFKYS